MRSVAPGSYFQFELPLPMSHLYFSLMPAVTSLHSPLTLLSSHSEPLLALGFLSLKPQAHIRIPLHVLWDQVLQHSHLVPSVTMAGTCIGELSFLFTCLRRVMILHGNCDSAFGAFSSSLISSQRETFLHPKKGTPLGSLIR